MKKSISTQATPTNIASVRQMLAETPPALHRLGDGLAAEARRAPLESGERSLMETVAHIVHCEERTTESIYAALLLDAPLILAIHPERQWGALLGYAACEWGELLAYFAFRRRALLRVLDSLDAAGWARAVREAGKQRQESVYWRARAMALHEDEHLAELAARLGG